MTVGEAISGIDRLKHNDFSREDKLAWLSNLDWKVKRQIIDTHEGGNQVCFRGYDADTFPEKRLLVPPPYDEIYLRWLEAQIDYHNGDMKRYNNAIALYNTAFAAFANFYNRTHMPLGKHMKFF